MIDQVVIIHSPNLFSLLAHKFTLYTLINCTVLI